MSEGYSSSLLMRQGFLNIKKSSLPTTEFFDPNWLSLIKLYQNNLLPVQVIAKKETQQWFQYFPNQDNPAES